MTVAKGVNTYNHIRLARINHKIEKYYEVRDLRLIKTGEKLFIYLVNKDVDPNINYEWRLAKGHTFDKKEDIEIGRKIDRSWKAKEFVDKMNENGQLIAVKEHGSERNVYAASMIVSDPMLVDRMTKKDLVDAFNEIAPRVGYTRLDDWKASKAALVGRIVESYGKLDGRKRRRATA